MEGTVRRPAIYELNGEAGLTQVLDLAGGLLVSANMKQIRVERIDAHQGRTMFNLQLPDDRNDAQQKLEPVITAETRLAELDRRIEESKKTEQTAGADEARDRENLTALKGNDAAKRFVDELNRAEDQLQATRTQTADLEQQKQAATEKLDSLISGLRFEWSVTEK